PSLGAPASIRANNGAIAVGSHSMSNRPFAFACNTRPLFSTMNAGAPIASTPAINAMSDELSRRSARFGEARRSGNFTNRLASTATKPERDDMGTPWFQPRPPITKILGWPDEDPKSGTPRSRVLRVAESTPRAAQLARSLTIAHAIVGHDTARAIDDRRRSAGPVRWTSASADRRTGSARSDWSGL